MTKDIPEELLAKRNIIECNFIFSLYMNTEALDDYKNLKNTEDIITEDGVFYLEILRAMVKAGFNEITDMSISTFCEDKESVKKGYERRGGWETIQDIMNVVSYDNIDAYYDELVKNNMLIRLYKKGFNVLDDLDKFNLMTSEEVYAYFEYQLATIGIDRIEKIQVDNLSDDYDKWIDVWDKSPEVGFPVGISMLNYKLAGIHRKNLTLHIAGIGKGKTTSAIAWYIIPAIKEGHNICIIANEQDNSTWRQMILSTVMFNEIGGVTKGLNRHKMLYGNFTDEQKERMREAGEWIKAQKGKITFIDVDNYDVSSVKKLVTKYSKLGNAFFVIDTFKPPNDASDRAWAEFSEVAKALFMLSKTTNTAILCTAQLAPDAMNRKYLDLSCVGKSKAIAETASTVIMLRPLTTSEKEKVEPYSYDKETKQKVTHELDPEKDYVMIFTPKNRYGDTDLQIICERNMDFNNYKQIGWYSCPYDVVNRR